MTNLSSIVVLLQLVLTLLSSPSTANSTQAQTLATQAIGMATQALQANTTSTLSVSSESNPTQSSATGTLYCDSYSEGKCIGWKMSAVFIPSISISQEQNQSDNMVSIPSNCPSEVIDARQLPLIPQGCPTPTILDEQTQFANQNQLDFDALSVRSSTNDLYNLEADYATAKFMGSGTNAAEYEATQSSISALYNSLLQAAQLTLQNAEAQQKLDENYSINAGTEAQIQSEQLQNEACSSSYDFNRAGGMEGSQQQENASDCIISAQKEANDIQGEQ